jgi:single-strand DNA-binding protein
VNEPTINLSGNLAAKPTLRPVDTPSGPVVVANLRVAVTPRRRGKGPDEWSDGETMWFSVSAWRTAAANCVASLNQGDRVVVRGRLTQRTWKDANGVEHPSFEVDADDVALDVTRHPAMSLRNRPPLQRVEEPTAAEDEWVSTGQVDAATGQVLVAQLSEVDTGRETESEDEPVDDEPLAV